MVIEPIDFDVQNDHVTRRPWHFTVHHHLCMDQQCWQEGRETDMNYTPVGSLGLNCIANIFVFVDSITFSPLYK